MGIILVEVAGLEPASVESISILHRLHSYLNITHRFSQHKDKCNIMGVSKNNPGARQEQRKNLYQGKEFKPCLYDGRGVGKGKYMTGAINGDMILDALGEPMPFRSIPRD